MAPINFVIPAFRAIERNSIDYPFFAFLLEKFAAEKKITGKEPLDWEVTSVGKAKPRTPPPPTKEKTATKKKKKIDRKSVV